MVLESGQITSEGIERLRARLGSFNRPRQYGVGLFNEQASQDAIRHFCQGIGDPNPIYWDLSYAHATKFGTILAPPCFLYSVYWCSGRVGGLPGVHGFHAGNDWEWFRPIYLDDKISVQEQFTVKDYMSTPDEKRYQLLDGEMILAPSPTTRHQRLLLKLSLLMNEFVNANRLGEVFLAPYDVVLSDYDVAQPDMLFVSNDRSAIVTERNIQGAPDLVVEVLSPGTPRYDRGYKQVLYSRHGVREYWLVDPDAGTVEVLAESGRELAPLATYRRGRTLTSPLLEGLSIDLEQVFRQP